MKCPIRIYSCPIEKSGATSWIQILDLELSSEGYNEVGKLMEDKQIVKATDLGKSFCRLYSAKSAQECANEYFNSI